MALDLVEYDYPITLTLVQRGLTSSIIMALSVYHAGGGHNTEFVRGILAHAQSQAMLYGLNWPGIVADCQRAIGADVAGLLDAAIKGMTIEGG